MNSAPSDDQQSGPGGRSGRDDWLVRVAGSVGAGLAAAVAPWTGEEDYARGVREVYRRLPTPAAMLERAVCRMTSVSSERRAGS